MYQLIHYSSEQQVCYLEDTLGEEVPMGGGRQYSTDSTESIFVGAQESAF